MLTSIPTTLEPGEWARTLAEAGVNHNADWTPYTEVINGVLMSLVPAGCFMMGSTDEQIDQAMELYDRDGDRSHYEDEQPAHEVCFEEPFWIDVYEVTNAQFEAFGGQAFWSSDGTDDNQPREMINWLEADAFCQKRGARLPTEAEWEYAARGPDGLIYPWGNEFVADNVVYVGNSEHHTWDVCSKPGGRSWIDACDLSGNVGEWVADWYRAYSLEQQIDPADPENESYRVLHPGSWNYFAIDMRAASRTGMSPDIHTNQVGFRCGGAASAATPELSPMPEPISTLDPGFIERARLLAEAGVTHNADWTPYTEEINGVLMALVPTGWAEMALAATRAQCTKCALRNRSGSM